MAITTCKECSKEVSDTAPTCPHCGAVLIVPASWGGRLGKWLLWGCLGLVLLAIIGQNVKPSDTKLCETAVEPYLKSPATADFSLRPDMMGDVSGTLDAQNGFGANIRSQVKCDIETNGTGGRYVKDICMNEKSLYTGRPCF